MHSSAILLVVKGLPYILHYNEHHVTMCVNDVTFQTVSNGFLTAIIVELLS